jgi:exoribonuclease R
MSDIYVNGSATDNLASAHHLQTLRQAAKSRGTSRYDLPLGPLHLLPPVVLRAFTFSEIGPSHCVTLWAYIDERDGKLLDAGIERTVVSAPYKLSFADANALLNEEANETERHAKAILAVVDRNLRKWSLYHQGHSTAARQRETRLSTRAKHPNNARSKFQSDNGSDGFRRTRSHRLVDAALDLYANASAGLLLRAKAPIPRAPGADESRGGRLATSPLRRYIDGQAQRQLLAVLCQYGEPLSFEECTNWERSERRSELHFQCASRAKGMKSEIESKPFF